MYDKLHKLLFKNKPIGRSLIKLVKNLEPRLYQKLAKENFTENLYLALGFKNLGCIVCKKVTKFITLYRGYAKFCSIKCSRDKSVSITSRPKLPFIKQLEKIFIEKCKNRKIIFNKVFRGRETQKIKDLAKKLNVKPMQIVYHMYVSPNVEFCKSCNNPSTFKNVVHGYNEYCCYDCTLSDKAIESKNNKIRNTCRKKYGVNHIMQVKNIRDKVEKTNLKRYGGIAPIHNQTVKDKMKATNLKRHGVEFASQNSKVKQKIKATFLKRYGVEHALQVPKFIKKAKKTLHKNFGVSHNSYSRKIRNKRKETTRKNYGVDHHYQDTKVFYKLKINLYRTKYIYIQGKKFAYQGYEHFFLDYLVKKFGVRAIKTKYELPKIIYHNKNKSKRYYPDLMVDKTIYEVKCSYTLGARKNGTKTFNINKLKAKAVLAAGYRFKCAVYDRTGKLLLLDDLQKERKYYVELLQNCKD
jgi:hypothetical protein